MAAPALVLAWGCADPDLGDVSTGVYSLEVERIFDNCQPQRATGRFESAVQVRSDGLTLWVPTGTVIPRMVPAELDEDLEASLPPDPVDECEGGERNRKVTVTGTSSDSVGVAVTDVFAGLASCPSDSFAAPAEDCRSERRLRYLRRERCAEGCSIAAGAEGTTFRCVCAGDAGM